MVIELATAALFVSFTLFAYLIGRRLQTKKPVVTQPAAKEIFVRPVLGDMTNAMAATLPMGKRKRKQLQKDLLAAGRYHATAMDNFLAVRNTVILIELIILAAAFATGLAERIELYVLGGGLITVIFTYSIPTLLIASRAKSRKSKIEQAIPDVLDLLSMAVAGGLPITAAIERVNEQVARSYPALSRELQIICNQCSTGSMDIAFQKFADRIQIPEVVSWASLMKQSSRLGGGIADALQQYAHRIREDRNLRIEKAGNTASIRMLLPVVLCIAPPIFVILTGPALLDVRDFLTKEQNSPSSAVSQFNDAREQMKLIDLSNDDR